eukprot:TRINITY_DN7430_c0_g1_i2.p1 TRINITY_DN7430_c0_g1~~TRINITY_DN7430_c0_g1_i2.p1  ORF type:complete len:383 (-),score=66.41 TRINITY_DN7430_c0_g1_i2:537-1685(-)
MLQGPACCYACLHPAGSRQKRKHHATRFTADINALFCVQLAFQVLCLACARQQVIKLLEQSGIFYKKAVNMLRTIHKCLKLTITDLEWLCLHVSPLPDVVLPLLLASKDASIAVLLLELSQSALVKGVAEPSHSASEHFLALLDVSHSWFDRMLSLSNPGEIVRWCTTLAHMYRQLSACFSAPETVASDINDVVADALVLIVKHDFFPVAEQMVSKWTDTTDTPGVHARFKQLVLAAMLHKAIKAMEELHEAYSMLNDDQKDNADKASLWVSLLTTFTANSVLKVASNWHLSLSDAQSEAIEGMICARLLSQRAYFEAAEYAEGQYYLEQLVEAYTHSSVDVLLEAGALAELEVAENCLKLPESVQVKMVDSVQGGTLFVPL